MTSELRWILLLIGVVFIAGLALWERRRPRQASASSASERPAPRDLIRETAPRAPREPTLTLPEMRARDPLPTQELPVVDMGSAAAQGRTPVQAVTAASAPSDGDELTDEVAMLGAAAQEPAPQRTRVLSPVTAPAEASGTDPASRPSVPDAPSANAQAAASAPAVPPREVLPELPAAAAPLVEWPPDDKRQIVALRLVAPQPQRFAGRTLRQALAAEGFVLGRFAIFHKPDEERRAVLSAASLNRPGTFDADTMDSQHYGGLSLFAVLPGPKPPPQAFDELVFTARSLNDRLQGVLQDEQGGPLTPSRIASLRERLGAGAAL
jgi:cell division protein ZipA